MGSWKRYNTLMSTTPFAPADMPFEAAAFAARAHRHQTRKDNQTPYVSHVFRVCLVVRHTFGFNDPKMLAAALLHDTIEDTATDCDDIIDRFGPDVARWVAALTKDMRLPHDDRPLEGRPNRAGKVAELHDWRQDGDGHMTTVKSLSSSLTRNSAAPAPCRGTLR